MEKTLENTNAPKYIFKFSGYRYNNDWNYKLCEAEIIANTLAEAEKEYKRIFNLQSCNPQLIRCKALLNKGD